MSTHFASHFRESIIGHDATPDTATVHDMASIRQLACAVIQRAVDDAQGVGWHHRANAHEAKQFLLGIDQALDPWCQLAGLNPAAVREYAMKQGYEESLVATPHLRRPCCGAKPSGPHRATCEYFQGVACADKA